MMERKKIVQVLDTPYSAVQWPQIDAEHQDTLLELICSLLAPIGEYRRNYITPSKGRRSRSRKRKRDDEATVRSQQPAAPDVASFVDVGLAKITRTLQDAIVQTQNSPSAKTLESPESPPYSVLVVARSGQTSAFHCHLPQMVAAATQSQGGTTEPIRLVGFSKPCEDRLSAALGLPRVSSVAIKVGAPLLEPLVDFARKHVPVIHVPWLDEAMAAQFLPTKFKAVATVVGTKTKKTT